MNIRRFQSIDADQIAQLFHDTIRTVNLGDYTEEQVKVWAPDDIHFRDWNAKCSSKFTLVAESEGIIAGFAQLDFDGHIDCFYCHKDFQGQGVGKLLYSGLENEAQKQGLNKLYVEVSITAKPFFLKMGFTSKKKQEIIVRGVCLINFRMEKIIARQASYHSV
ncbi:GNAT family N-acetyltransferase [Rhodohalobacter sp. 614A]|uniref:GNAT family N-acetyltransferase n=1 Tax=Rhodohalobacter sp. 614A TaxID=2908649 RepID=UPI001F3D2101|nr:GNAT family N-acetyltransferase [Rhodohalobacter sp. 614A]